MPTCVDNHVSKRGSRVGRISYPPLPACRHHETDKKSALRRCEARQARMFFFEKKNQKTSTPWAAACGKAHANVQKSSSFFQKRSPSLCA
jgi:hypothetical protein